MAQRIVVYASPVAIHKSTHKQKQRALRLMKVGYQHFYNLIFVSRCDNYLCTAMENIYAIIVQPRYNVAYGIIRRHAAIAVVRFPLLHMKAAFRHLLTVAEMYTYIIQALQRTDTCRSN